VAEPLVAAPSGPAVPERGVLLATKLHVPRPRPGFVPRPRLAERLDDGLAQGLVLVCAPAGYGKTTLLADWIQRGEHPVAWLCLDPADNDPARFWRHTLAALDGVCPGIAGWQAAGQPALTAWHRVQLAQVQRALGRLDAAVQTYEQALEAIAVPGRPLPPTAGPVYLGLAEVAYQRNELDRALGYVTEGIALSRQFLYGPSPAPGWVTLAWIRQAAGDPAGALEAIGEAEQASPVPAGLLYPAPAQRARLLLAQGDVAAAARWTDETGLHADDEPRYPREPGYLVLARVLLAQERPAEALALLDRLYAAAVAQGRVGSVIEAGALRALALAACGQDADAVDTLADVLTLACPQGYVRVFADEGPPMAALLTRLIAAQRAGSGFSGFQAAASVPLGYLARLRSAFGAEPAAPHTAAVPGLIDPLTSRELEVLQMLAAGKSNQAIAGELVVTLDTVKKHVSHLLGKLGAANRTEAVTRARQLGLIP
jgi:LuxR family maltose regulon positive regulatory protein